MSPAAKRVKTKVGSRTGCVCFGPVPRDHGPVMLDGGQLGMFNGAYAQLRKRQQNRTRAREARTGDVHDVGDARPALDRGQKRRRGPRDAIRLARDAHDAEVRRRREVLHCARTHTHIRSDPRAVKVGEKHDAPLRDAPTAPQPVSPKCAITLWRRAAQMCFPVSSTPPLPPRRAGSESPGAGRNSTRIQRFYVGHSWA